MQAIMYKKAEFKFHLCLEMQSLCETVNELGPHAWGPVRWKVWWRKGRHVKDAPGNNCFHLSILRTFSDL